MNNPGPLHPTRQHYADLEAEIVEQSRSLHKAQRELNRIQHSLDHLHSLMDVWEDVVKARGFRDE